MADKRLLAGPRLVYDLVIKPLSTMGRVVAGLTTLVTVALPLVLPFLGWPWSASLLLLVLLILSWITLHRVARPSGPEIDVAWSEGDLEFVPRLVVTNRGEVASFTGKMELLEIRNLGAWKPGDVPTLYKPAWNETVEPDARIARGDFRYLLLAKLKPVTEGEQVRGAQFGFYRLTRGGIEWTPDHSWSGDPRPVFVVRVSLLTEPPPVEPFERIFEIECLRTQCRLRAPD